MSSLAHVLTVVAVSGGLAIAACGDSSGDSKFDPTNGTSSGDQTSGGFGSSGTSGASGSSGASSSGASGGNCFAPVDMYFMFDQSGSMDQPGFPQDTGQGDCNVGVTPIKNSKWCKAVNALSGYLNSPQSKDQAAAVQFFSGSTSTGRCNGSMYSNPASPASAYTTLPSNSFDAVLNGPQPGGGTPTEGAIRGLNAFTAANRRGGRVTVNILITDGDPQSCDTNLTNLSNLLQAHHTATMIRTFVIGMNGASFDKLEQIAQGGNGPPHPATVGSLTNACGSVAAPCRFWNVGDGDPQGFISAIAAIQEASNGCNPGGGFVNPVN